MRKHAGWWAAALCGLAAAVGGAAQTVSLRPEKLVDLSHEFSARTLYWPTDEGFQYRRTKFGKTPGGYWYASGEYGGSEHGGTHLDSPYHFSEKGWTTEKIPLTRLVGPAAVVDVSAACAKDRNYRVRVEDLTAWESQHGHLSEGTIVLIRTGWSRFWPQAQQYLGTDKKGDVAHLQFPGLSKQAAEFLAGQRRVAGVGIDTASLDYGPSQDFVVHQVLNGANVYGLENVANLEALPATGATVLALPMKIAGGTGGPVRIIGVLP